MPAPTPDSNHTIGHVDCPACRRASLMHDVEISPDLKFPAAFELWLNQKLIDHKGVASNVRYISTRTERDLRQYARAAGRFFHSLRLRDIHAGHLREYQRARATCDTSCGAWAEAAGANLIRKEVATVVRVLRAAGCWNAHLEETFDPLPVAESDVGRAMTPDEQLHFLRVAASREPWRVVYWWAIVALQTTMSTNEMRALRLSDVNLHDGIVQVRSEGAKNKFRIRTIPLQTPEVVWAISSLLDRAHLMGARAAHHYLFPLHVTANRYDPEQPMTVWGLRKPWEAARTAAGLEWLRIYDLRHTAITRLAEGGAGIQVIMSFAGHISPKMQQHYTAISLQAKRRWAAAAWAGAEMPFHGGMMPMALPAGSGMPIAQPAPMASIVPAVPMLAPALSGSALSWQEQAMAAGWMPAAEARRAS